MFEVGSPKSFGSNLSLIVGSLLILKFKTLLNQVF